MAQWITVAHISEIEAGTKQAYQLSTGDHIIVANISGEFYAIADICTHDGGELADGELEDTAIVCSRHGAKFCLKTGAVLAPPAYEDIRVFPVRVVDNTIQVQAGS